ncbi:MAG: DUF5687 family protein [Bacteroidaceae bacterium]|nr:DUF5687 family protein [Bacteroidaceae bacterium]
MEKYISSPFNLDKKLNTYSSPLYKWKLYRLINKCKNVSERRHPMFEQNRAMKWLGYLGFAFWACYLIFFGVLLGNVDDGATEMFDIINGGLVFFLTCDFFLRMFLVDTPAQEVKQFKLMPISSSFLINIFLVRRGTSIFNIIWLFFFVPFGFFSLLHFYGFCGFIGWCIALWLIFVANSYWYLLWRTLLNRNMLFIIIPVVLYAVFIYLGIFDDEYTKLILGDDNTQPVFWTCLKVGRWALELNPIAYVIPIVAIGALYSVNYFIQIRSVYREIAEVQAAKVKSREMAFLNRFGIVGEYIKLDIKSIMRNNVIRQSFLSGLVCTIMLTCIFAFTPIYDDMLFMKAYISMYCYCALSVITLTGVMCAEGNYIDGLMSRKESVLSLLKAKYYFNLFMMIIPFLIFMIPIIQGKNSFMESVGCLLFTAGVVLPCLMQMAVYNKNTIPLNAKLTKARSNSKTQMIVSMIALFGPMIIMYALMVLLTDWASYAMAAIGLVGVLLEPIWLRNIYKRFMARRYENMDGFRNSRNN